MASWGRLSDSDYDRLNPPPDEMILLDDGGMAMRLLDDERWLHVGYVPTPRTRLGWFVHHVAHGLAMRYPWHKVLLWSLQESHRRT